jgi:hypothetical protein
MSHIEADRPSWRKINQILLMTNVLDRAFALWWVCASQLKVIENTGMRTPSQVRQRRLAKMIRVLTHRGSEGLYSLKDHMYNNSH